MSPDSLTPNPDFIFQARICLEISPISYSDSHDEDLGMIPQEAARIFLLIAPLEATIQDN